MLMLLKKHYYKGWIYGSISFVSVIKLSHTKINAENLYKAGNKKQQAKQTFRTKSMQLNFSLFHLFIL